jgi:hypothetical protein
MSMETHGRSHTDVVRAPLVVIRSNGQSRSCNVVSCTAMSVRVGVGVPAGVGASSSARGSESGSLTHIGSRLHMRT